MEEQATIIVTDESNKKVKNLKANEKEERRTSKNERKTSKMLNFRILFEGKHYFFVAYLQI